VKQKTITVLIDEAGNSTVDLEGFAGQGCEKALKDFQGDDYAKIRRRKASCFSGAAEQQGEQRTSGR
jgi:hypothetical protein